MGHHLVSIHGSTPWTKPESSTAQPVHHLFGLARSCGWEMMRRLCPTTLWRTQSPILKNHSKSRPTKSFVATNDWLVGGFKPSEKDESQLGWLSPTYGKKSCSKPPTSWDTQPSSGSLRGPWPGALWKVDSMKEFFRNQKRFIGNQKVFFGNRTGFFGNRGFFGNQKVDKKPKHET